MCRLRGGAGSRLSSAFWSRCPRWLHWACCLGRRFGRCSALARRSPWSAFWMITATSPHVGVCWRISPLRLGRWHGLAARHRWCCSGRRWLIRLAWVGAGCGLLGVVAESVQLHGRHRRHRGRGGAMCWRAGGRCCMCWRAADACRFAAHAGGGGLGFLFWNFPPARIFMGDAGSGFLGITLGRDVLAGRVGQARSCSGRWVILLGVFIVDATVTLVRRLLRGEKVYEAHRSHAYQFASRRFGAPRAGDVGGCGDQSDVVAADCVAGRGGADRRGCRGAGGVGRLALGGLAHRFRAGAVGE